MKGVLFGDFDTGLPKSLTKSVKIIKSGKALSPCTFYYIIINYKILS